ncbi:MAG: hypothetical protein K5769_07125 [Pseudobutyrivibrio sp.]|nr:hypothetical protein [Pseudobutyrivibrio sp.]
MKNKTLVIFVFVVAALLVTSLVLLKLGIFNKAITYEAEAKEIQQINSVEDMEPEKLYIWKDCADKEISATNNKFQICPMENSNYKLGKSGSISAHYTVWVDSKSDTEIPTLTSKDKLLFYSKTYVPDEYKFLRLYENGYSLGITSLLPDKSDNYYLDYKESNKNAYKQHINEDSDAGDLLGLDVGRLYLDKVGGQRITEKNVTEDGIVKGLKKDKTYKCEFYIGSLYQDYNLKANQHTFTEFGEENFTCHGYDYLHSNCVSIDIPDWLCSGYYIFNGIGMFRYVDDTDVASYNGEPYDANIDWNEPLILYNERGDVIFDPSKPVEDETDAEQEQDYESEGAPEEVSSVDASEWKREIPEGEKFTAEINIAKVVNAEPANLTVVAPDGSEENYVEEDGKILVEIYEPKKGDYSFKIEQLGGRTFDVNYSDGETYSGPDN